LSDVSNNLEAESLLQPLAEEHLGKLALTSTVSTEIESYDDQGPEKKESNIKSVMD
jgi:hypothetical protein